MFKTTLEHRWLAVSSRRIRDSTRSRYSSIRELPADATACAGTAATAFYVPSVSFLEPRIVIDTSTPTTMGSKPWGLRASRPKQVLKWGS